MPESKIRPAVLELKPAGDPIYLVEESEPGPEQGSWRTYGRPKVDPISRNADGIALQGYVVVSYFENHPEKGRKQFSVERDGGEVAVQQFGASQAVPGSPGSLRAPVRRLLRLLCRGGYLATADARACEIDGSKLHRFYDEAVRAVWAQNQRQLVNRAEKGREELAGPPSLS